MARARHPLLGDREWFKARIDAGRSRVEIAQDAGLTSSTVSLVEYYVRKHGLQGQTALQRGKKPHPLLGDREWLKLRVDAGLSQTQIAAEVGLSKTKTSLVAYYVRKHGLRENLPRPERVSQALTERYPNGRRGPLAGNWRGGRRSTTGTKPGGYIRLYAPDHPGAVNGYVYEHRYVMEQKLGRLLRPGELVDHIDRNRSNNHLDNLRLQPSRSAHVKDHFSARDQLAEKDQRIAELEAKLKAYEAQK